MNARTFRGVVAAALLAGCATSAQEQANRYPYAKGRIEKIDPSAKQIVLRTSDGVRLFSLTERTYIFRGKEKLSVDKLKIGEAIKIQYSTNETGLAVIKRLKIDQSELPDTQ